MASPCAAAAAGLLVSAVTVSAQVPPKPPGTVRPGQIERQFERPPEPSAKPGAIVIPATGQTPPQNADGIHFLLNELRIDGVTVYAAESLRSVYAPRLGTQVTLADVYRIVETLTARYRNDGYILSQVIVPAQSVENGSIRLQAVEGYVAEVRVEGGSAAMRARVQKHAERIRDSRPLAAAVLERHVLLVNDLPGIQARAVLTPSQTPGAADLVLQVARERIDAGVSLDNRGSEAQGLQRLFADVHFQNLVGASLTELRQVTTATEELVYVAAAHEQFLGTSGGTLGVTGSYVYSRPQEISIVPLDLMTRSQTVAVTYTYPLVRSRARNIYLHTALTAFNSESTVFDIEDSTDRIRAARLGVTYDFGDRFGGITIADAEFSQGINGLGATANGDAYLSRPTGRSDFQKATVYLARIQALPARWSAVVAVDSQYAFTDLLSPELFSVGGEQFGRGYDPSEILNDHGAAAKFELRYTRAWERRRPILLMPYGFVDGGRVWQRTPMPGISAAQSVTSAGAGVHVQVGALFSGFVEFASPVGTVAEGVNTRPKVRVGLSIR